MSIPRFTAEASLYRTDGYHQIAGIGAISRAEVIPARLCCEACIENCADDPNPTACLRSGPCRNCIVCGRWPPVWW